MENLLKNLNITNFSNHDYNQYFNKIINLLKNLDSLTIDDVIDLLKNNKTIYNIVGYIVEKNYNSIISNNFVDIVKDDTAILIIEAYCSINNIEIKYNLEDNIINENLSDETVQYNDDLAKIYLQEINKPVLTKDEEIELGYRLLKHDKEARKIMIERNLKLVVFVSRKYINRGISFLDIIQEGNLGLMHAIDKYDVTKEYRFSTYAVAWIRSYIEKSLFNKTRNIKIPLHVQTEIIKYKKIEEKLYKKLERVPSYKEIANEMNISVQEVKNLHKYQQDTNSLNILIGNDEETEYIEMVASDDLSIEDNVLDSFNNDEIHQLMQLANLKEKEIQMLSMRFGFFDNSPKTLQEIGNHFNLTRERVRQIVENSLRKLRNAYIKREEKIKYDKQLEEMQNSLNLIMKNNNNFRK